MLTFESVQVVPLLLRHDIMQSLPSGQSGDHVHRHPDLVRPLHHLLVPRVVLRLPLAQAHVADLEKANNFS